MHYAVCVLVAWVLVSCQAYWSLLFMHAGSEAEQTPAASEAGDLGILKGLLEGQGVTGALDHSKIEGVEWHAAQVNAQVGLGAKQIGRCLLAVRLCEAEGARGPLEAVQG